jgi:hypothetical protein
MRIGARGDLIHGTAHGPGTGPRLDLVRGQAYKCDMTKKDFARRVLNAKKDVLGEFLGLLRARRIRFCVIGGLAVNAYSEPVVSLDLDIVVEEGRLAPLIGDLPASCRVKEFPNSLNIDWPGSDLRIQVHKDPRYQAYLAGARMKDVLGYRIPVARAEDVLQGKAWAALDGSRRPSKRQKDLADILRLLESRPALRKSLPKEILERFPEVFAQE